MCYLTSYFNKAFVKLCRKLQKHWVTVNFRRLEWELKAPFLRLLNFLQSRREPVECFQTDCLIINGLHLTIKACPPWAEHILLPAPLPLFLFSSFPATAAAPNTLNSALPRDQGGKKSVTINHLCKWEEQLSLKLLGLLNIRRHN